MYLDNNEKEKKVVVFKLSPSYREVLREYAKLNGRSVAKQVEIEMKKIIEKYLESKEEIKKNIEKTSILEEFQEKF